MFLKCSLIVIGVLTSVLTLADATPPLTMSDLRVGSGAVAVNGKTLTIHYIATLETGKELRNSRKEGAPIKFILGKGQVIPGLERGILGMKLGGTRKLVVPPQLAYGYHSLINALPPNSTLIFEIELLKVE